MISQSVPLMILIDVVVVTLAILAIVWLRLRHKGGLQSGGAIFVTAGLGFVGAFYFADLFIMVVLPAIAPSLDTMSMTTFLHMNMGWFAFPAAGSLVFAGFILLIRQETALLRVARETSRELRANEERYRAVVETQTEFIVRWLPDGTRTFVNEAYAGFYAEPREKILGRSFFPLVSEEERKHVLDTIGLLTPANPLSSSQHQRVLPNGNVTWQEWTDRGIFDETGKLVEVQSVGRDITDLKRTKDALEESEMLFRSTVENSLDIVTIVGADARIVYQSPAFSRTLGYSAADRVGQDMLEHIHPEDRELVRGALRRAIVQPQDAIVTTECRVRHADGTWRSLESVGKAWSFAGRTVVVINSRDVSERQGLQREILEISERERERLGRELHDGIGQQLTGLALMAKALESKLVARGAPEADWIRDLRETAAVTLNQTRFLARGLFPIPMEGRGLGDALEELAETASLLYQLPVHADVDTQVRIGSAEAAAHLYSIAREAVTNSVRHGRADHVTIRLHAEPNAVRLSVEDDGIGVPGADELREGVGFRSMRHRAHELQADLEVLRRETGGTLLQCLVSNFTLQSHPAETQTSPDQ